MLISSQFRLIVAGVVLSLLLGGVAVTTWTIQNWRHGIKLEQQARIHSSVLNKLTLEAVAQQRAEYGKRLVLEERLQSQEQIHYREFSNAQKNQARIRDRLSTADLRLSVLLDTNAYASNCAMSATAAAGGVVYGTTAAELDAAHAERIIRITDAGDQGLIALAACQAYIKEVSSQ